MAYEEKKNPARQHNIILESRSKVSISGVENVDSFDDCELVVLTSQGNLIVSGSNLHIDSLNLDSCDLLVDGLVTSLVYEETAPSSSLWSKLFK